MANEPIPVYVFTGFLESGKTKFIQDILADPNFTENERTVLLLCEEGIEEYDEKWLLHYGTALVPIESEDRLTPNILKRVEQKYQPDRILVEYNGMWKLEKLMQDLQAMLDTSPLTNHGTNIVQLASFGDSSINILISAYLLTNVYAEFLQMQNDLNLNILDIMQADGVDFAFPSTSVYIEKN